VVLARRRPTCEIGDLGAAGVTAIDIDPRMVARARRRLARLFHHPPDRFTNAQMLAEMEAVALTPIGIEDRPGQLLVVARRE
jgi:hypothetical protein